MIFCVCASAQHTYYSHTHTQSTQNNNTHTHKTHTRSPTSLSHNTHRENQENQTRKSIYALIPKIHIPYSSPHCISLTTHNTYISPLLLYDIMRALLLSMHYHTRPITLSLYMHNIYILHTQKRTNRYTYCVTENKTTQTS